MEFKEIDVPECIIPQISQEGRFADIAVDVGNRDNIYSNVNLDMSYEDTLPKKGLIHNWSSVKMFEEMNLERERYLLSTDELLEEWHSCK